MKNRLGFAIALVFALTLGTSAAFASVKQTSQAPSSSNQSSMTAKKSSSSSAKRRRAHRRHHRKTARAAKTSGNKNTRS